MPFVNIRFVRENITENAEAKKAAIADKVSKAIGEAMGISPGSVWVVFEDVGAADWYVGPDSVETLRKKK
ncbi:MAG: 4-oxalocrotonate tautomerase family protein [Bauldia sp.]|nr:MAG: 4-oxalocrotonate tautomerase family protein [Bauldia sp.]MBZ0229608.1 4-oxalocrotonate tautomerase family protein [Bauldia sp.]